MFLFLFFWNVTSSAASTLTSPSTVLADASFHSFFIASSGCLKSACWSCVPLLWQPEGRWPSPECKDKTVIIQNWDACSSYHCIRTVLVTLWSSQLNFINDVTSLSPAGSVLGPQSGLPSPCPRDDLFIPECHMVRISTVSFRLSSCKDRKLMFLFAFVCCFFVCFYLIEQKF